MSEATDKARLASESFMKCVRLFLTQFQDILLQRETVTASLVDNPASDSYRKTKSSSFVVPCAQEFIQQFCTRVIKKQPLPLPSRSGKYVLPVRENRGNPLAVKNEFMLGGCRSTVQK